MRARREVTFSVLCILLVACSAAASAPDGSGDPTVNGVGILPGSNPESVVITTDTATAATAATTTTLIPQQQIGTLVTGNRLLMIGDSITASAAKRYGGELCDALVPLGWQVEVDAEPSRFIDFGNQVLDKRLAAKWDAAYVFLGTNYLGDQASYRRQLEKIVERLSPSPIVLLTVTEFADNRREVNDVITLVAAQFSNVQVLDWGSIAAADAAKILRGDGHHLTNDGRAVLASTVAGVMGQAPEPEGECLGTSFSNDEGASVNGSDTPPPKPVGVPTTSTVKPTTSTTKPTGTVATSTQPTSTTVAGPTTPTNSVPPTTVTVSTTQPPPAGQPTTTGQPPVGGTSP